MRTVKLVRRKSGFRNTPDEFRVYGGEALDDFSETLDEYALPDGVQVSESFGWSTRLYYGSTRLDIYPRRNGEPAISSGLGSAQISLIRVPQ